MDAAQSTEVDLTLYQTPEEMARRFEATARFHEKLASIYRRQGSADLAAKAEEMARRCRAQLTN